MNRIEYISQKKSFANPPQYKNKTQPNYRRKNNRKRTMMRIKFPLLFIFLIFTMQSTLFPKKTHEMKGFIFPTPKKSIILLFFFFFAFLRTLNVYKFCIMNNLFIRKSTNSCIMSTMCVYYENIFLAGER